MKPLRIIERFARKSNSSVYLHKALCMCETPASLLTTELSLKVQTSH